MGLRGLGYERSIRFSSLVTNPTSLGLGFTYDIGLFSSNHSGFWHCQFFCNTWLVQMIGKWCGKFYIAGTLKHHVSLHDIKGYALCIFMRSMGPWQNVNIWRVRDVNRLNTIHCSVSLCSITSAWCAVISEYTQWAY